MKSTYEEIFNLFVFNNLNYFYIFMCLLFLINYVFKENKINMYSFFIVTIFSGLSLFLLEYLFKINFYFWMFKFYIITFFSLLLIILKLTYNRKKIINISFNIIIFISCFIFYPDFNYNHDFKEEPNREFKLAK